MAIGDPCFGKTYNRLRAALVEAVVMPQHVPGAAGFGQVKDFWRCVLCEKRWAMRVGDVKLRHLAEPHAEDCVLACPFNGL